MLPPLVFEPYFRPQIWGETRLQRFLGKALPPGGRFGESWEISAHPLHVSRVAEGPWTGATLTDLWSAYRDDFHSSPTSSRSQFPLLLKLLDCHEPLSVQVHPNDDAAHELLGEPTGKTEAWVVMHAEPGSRIYAGLQEWVTRADLEAHLDRGTVIDCLHSFEPRVGDCILIEAGTVHAVGGGVVIAEIQQSSDATFRLFDWNRPGPNGRPRTIHRDASLRCVRWDRGPISPIRNVLDHSDISHVEERLIHCDYFELSRINLRATEMTFDAELLTMWLIASGHAQLRDEATGYDRRFVAGETVLIPAHTTRHLNWSSEQATLLRVTPA